MSPPARVASGRPSASAIASTGRPPGRSSTGAPSSKPRMVDSRPSGQAPPSRTAAMRPPRPSRTCARVVGLTRPEGLAEGAASGPPKAASRRCASGCAGTRSATVARPAVARSARPESGRRGRTSVSGPGQKRVGERAGLGREHGEALGGGEVGDVHDQRVEGGPALGGEDAGDRRGRCGRRRRGRRRSRSGRRRARPRAGAPAAARRPRVAVGERDGVALGHRLTRRPACGARRPALASAAAGAA